jgi:hypothetical protein
MNGVLRRRLLVLIFAAASASFGTALGQDAAGDAPAEQELQWPRVVEGDGMTFTVYQPQIDKFADAMLEARAAVKIDTQVGEKTQTSYGVIWITAQTFIDKENELVELSDIQITKANFPTSPEKTDEYLRIMREATEPTRTVSLERIEANLAITQADKKGDAVPLKNDPPKIYYRSTPAILVIIDGDPALRPVEGASGLQRVINTKSLIVQSGGSFYLALADAWLQAPSAEGPYRRTSSPPSQVQALHDAIAKDEKQASVDLMEEPGEEIEAVLKEGKAPEIIVSTVPAELLVTQGKPQMKPISGTNLLYVDNTSGDMFLDLNDQSYYVALTGRWYRSKSLDKGPWTFVEGDDLPKDFSKIATSNPKANVLATVPGTPAAQEAVIANSIPQTAEVNREEATYQAQYDGEPKFEPVPDTSLRYAVNSPTPVVSVSPTSYYSVQGGVWFTAGSPVGPWAVATVVPPVIYTIPTASPIHYVTYVRVYRYSPTTVWFGYTPGYLGTCYSPWGTVVYGTGWYYRPWIGSYWYGNPWTYGFGVGISWSPWTGWNVGFGWGGYYPIYRPWWGPYYGYRPVRPPGYYPPYYRPGYPRPMPYRPASINITNINVYNRPGIARPGVRPVTRPVTQPVNRPIPGQPSTRPGTRPVPGQPSTRPGQPSIQPVPGQPSTRPAPGQPSRPGTTQPGTRPSTRPGTRPADNVYAGPDGNVYRPQPGRPGNWEQNGKDGWKPVEPSRPSRPTTSQPSTRPAPSEPAARPAPSQPSRPTTDRSTLDQLSRDQRGRSAGDTRMQAPPPQRSQPAQRPPSSAPSSRPQPQPRQPASKPH